MKTQTIFLIAVCIICSRTCNTAYAQNPDSTLQLKYSSKSGDVWKVEIGCNPSPNDKRNCISYQVVVSKNGETQKHEFEVDQVERRKLDTQFKKVIPTFGADLTLFCQKIEDEYEKFSYGRVKYNFSIFSDLYGLSANQPNGLIQPNLEVSFPLFPTAYKKLAVDGQTRLHFFRNILTHLTYSKPDEHLRDLPTFKADTARTTRTYGVLQSRANLADIMQYSFLNFGVKLNVLTLVMRNHRLYLDGTATSYFTSVYDSLHARKINVPSLSLGLSTKFATHFTGRFNFQVYYSIQHLRAITNDIAISNGLQFQNKELILESLKKNAYAPSVNADAAGWFHVFGSTLSMRDALATKGEKFLKFSYFQNGSNFFFQIQLGYSANIDDFVKSFDKK